MMLNILKSKRSCYNRLLPYTLFIRRNFLRRTIVYTENNNTVFTVSPTRLITNQPTDNCRQTNWCNGTQTSTDIEAYSVRIECKVSLSPMSDADTRIDYNWRHGQLHIPGWCFFFFLSSCLLTSCRSVS